MTDKIEMVYNVNAQGQITLFPRCIEHHWVYQGHPPITTGCPGCWMCYYLVCHCLLPNDKKAERLDLLEAAIHHVCEQVENGTWDFQLDDHAKVTIHSDANINDINTLD